MSPIVATALGEPPFFLYCNHCRWDSAEVGITFEKPTGLAGAPFTFCKLNTPKLTAPAHSAVAEVRRLRPRVARVRAAEGTL